MAAHMFILYYGCLSMITPPVAVAAFVAANLANADPNKTGWVAMAFGWTIFVIPFPFVYSRTLLLKGDPALHRHRFRDGDRWRVVHLGRRDGLFAATSAGSIGLRTRVVGIWLIVPVGAFAAARWMNIAGAIMAVALLIYERMMQRAEPQPAPAPVAAAPAAPTTAADQRALLDRLGIKGSGEGE